MTEYRRIYAKFAGKCHACGVRHIQVGEMIVGVGRNWSALECHEFSIYIQNLLHYLEKDMLEKHNIALGVWGIPEGSTPTFTRAEFIRAAEKHGEIGESEKADLCRHWRGILDRDLSD